MEAYEILEADGAFVVLALGQPQLKFRTLEQAESAVRLVDELNERPCWQVSWPASLTSL